MYRGSTPRFTFTVTFPVDRLHSFVLSFEQGDKVILEKTIDDCEIYTTVDPATGRIKNTISIRLSVKESMMFEPARMLHIQLRAELYSDEYRDDEERFIQLVTKEITTYVYDTLYEGDLPDSDWRPHR